MIQEQFREQLRSLNQIMTESVSYFIQVNSEKVIKRNEDKIRELEENLRCVQEEVNVSTGEKVSLKSPCKGYGDG